MSHLGDKQQQNSCCSFKLALHVIFWTTPLLAVKLLRFILYVFLLSPAYVRLFSWYYLKSNHLRVQYKKSSSTCSLDIYSNYNTITGAKNLCSGTDENDSSTIGSNTNSEDEEDKKHEAWKNNHDRPRPVVIVVAGGGWLFSDKMWGGLLSRTFSLVYVIVVAPQYRNYPIKKVPCMVEDVHDAIRWTIQNCRKYGGDPDKIFLVGQSAGGHLVLCTVLRQIIKHMDQGEEDSQNLGFHPEQICGVMTIGAPCDLSAMQQDFAKFGCPLSFANSTLFASDMDSYDPRQLVRENPEIVAHMPPTRLFHGTKDRTVSPELSAKFVQYLLQLGCKEVGFTPYDGYEHAEAMLERIMIGDNRYHRDIVYSYILQWTNQPPMEKNKIISLNDAASKLCPKWLMVIGRWCKPI